MIEQTKNTMAELKLLGALKTVDRRLEEAINHGWGASEFLSSLMTDEKLYRDTSRTQRRIRQANFRTQASMERLDLTVKRSLSKNLVRELMGLPFLRGPARNVLIEGPTGVGKTYLASALGEYACRSGFTCTFTGISVLIEKLLMTRADGTYLRLRDRLIKTDLLIIDDMGLKKLPQEIVTDIHDILEERQNRATMITTQLPLKNWSEIIEDELALDTIVDKLANGTLHIKLEGESYRKKRGQPAPLDSHGVPVEIAAN